jgi:hypothetical protein
MPILSSIINTSGTASISPNLLKRRYLILIIAVGSLSSSGMLTQLNYLITEALPITID